MGLTSRIHLQQSSPNLNQIVGRSTGHSHPSKSGTRRPPNVAEKWPLEKKIRDDDRRNLLQIFPL